MAFKWNISDFLAGNKLYELLTHKSSWFPAFTDPPRLYWSYFSFWTLSFSQSWNILKIRRWLELLKKDHRNGISIVLFDLMSRGGHNLEFIFGHYLLFTILVAKKCRHKISLFWHGIRKALFFWHDLKTDSLFLTWHRHEHRHVDKSH